MYVLLSCTTHRHGHTRVRIFTEVYNECVCVCVQCNRIKSGLSERRRLRAESGVRGASGGQPSGL